MATYPIDEYDDDEIITRTYTGFLGVDFQNDSTQVDLRRSPFAINVYKDYNSNLGAAIETRPGHRIINHMEGDTVANYTYQYITKTLIHFTIDDTNYMIAHRVNDLGAKFSHWTNFPSEPATFVDLDWSVTSNTYKYFTFNSKLYLLSGENYQVVSLDEDGELEINDVSDVCYIPTTYFWTYDSAVSEYQPYNILTGWQKNEYRANETKTEYTYIPRYTDKFVDNPDVSLDDDGNMILPITINDNETTCKVPVSTSIRTFTIENPYTTTIDGVETTLDLEANDVIVFEFYQEPDECPLYSCDTFCLFDNRVFIAGDPNSKNTFYWSQNDNAEYFSYLNFENAGNSDDKINSMLAVSSGLGIIKDGDNDGTVFYASKITLDTDVMPVTYSVSQISATRPGIGECINLDNDYLYVSEDGLQSITTLEVNNERTVENRSGLVQSRLQRLIKNTRAEDGELPKLAIYRQYLVILLSGQIYLADSRQWNSVTQDASYEFFYWDSIGVYDGDDFYKASYILSKNDSLYFGTENGCVCKFNFDKTKENVTNGELVSTAYHDETIDDEITIFSCWQTPDDYFDYINYRKKTNKKGAYANFKSFAHSVAKLKIATNLVPFEDVKTENTGYFDFSDLDFADFTFNTSEKPKMYFKPKYKKWEHISMRFYSDEKDKPFGLFNVTMVGLVQSYVKE